MKDVNQIFEDAIVHWRDNRGVGSALIPPPIVDKFMVLGILQRLYNKNQNAITYIITATYNERKEIIEFLTSQEDKNNNEEFKKLLKSNIKVFTESFVNNCKYHISAICTIIYHPDKFGDKLKALLRCSKFRLVVMNILPTNQKLLTDIYSICPLLNDFKQNEIDELRTSTPVEEIMVGITVPDDSETFKLLKYYNEYITTSLNIFGSFEVMEQVRIGNTKLNISSNTICDKIARENGWNEHLDMNIELNLQIDALYNPANIKCRAIETYEIIRNRGTLLSDYEGKLKEVYEIVKENKDSKILIISKRGEFASKITEYLNTYNEKDICANYHDKVDSVPGIDENGDPIYYKTGPHKGERKFIASKAQKTINEKLFNKGIINVLSTSNAPDKDLCIDVDLVIITSPICESIENYLYRLSNINIIGSKLKLYSLYVKNSLEQSKLQSKDRSENHKIVNNCENCPIIENNSDFIVVD